MNIIKSIGFSIRARLTWVVTGMVVFVYGCSSVPQKPIDLSPEAAKLSVEQLMVVDCLLPGQVRQLGSKFTYLSPRRPIKTTATDCEIRGGEYVSFDRSNYATALKIWLPQAKAGDPEAQTYVGEIFEKGLGIEADYAIAASWYKKAADQGHSRAQINLGYLYEGGLGVARDLSVAMNWYRLASGLTDGDLEFVSSIEVANRQAKEIEHKQLQTENAVLKSELSKTQAALANRQQTISASENRIATLKKSLQEKRLALADAKEQGTATAVAGQTAKVDPLLEKKLKRAEKEQKRLSKRLAEEQLASLKIKKEQQQTLALLESSRRTLASEKGQLQLAKQQLSEQEKILSTSSSDKQKLASLNTKVATLLKKVQQQEQKTEVLAVKTSQHNSDLKRQVGQSEASRLELQTALEQRNSEVLALQQQRSDADSNHQKQLLAAENKLNTALEEGKAQVALLNKKLQASEALNDEQVLAINKKLKSAKDEQKRLTTKLATQRLASRSSNNAQIAKLKKELQSQEALVVTQRTELQSLEGQLLQTQARLKNDAGSAVVATVSAGPIIEIIDPPLLATRGTPQINLRSAVSEIEIIGRVKSTVDLLSFRINDQVAKLESNGVFRISQGVRDVSTSVNLVAVDSQGQRTALEFVLNPRKGKAKTKAAKPQKFGPKSVKGVDFGNYYALVIGNNKYSKLTNLKTAAHDARVVAGILENKYGFNTTTLINADRYTMLSELNKLRETLTEDDNLIIYYAGHGELDKVNLRGYWLPVDSEADSSTNWISNIAITDILNVMNARHILVVADSCYSGSMTRSSVARLDAGLTNEA